MISLVTSIRSAIAHPARRRFWLTVGSGGLIAAGLLARYGFGMVEAWTALMVAAAFLAGSDIAIRAWRSLRVKHFSIELLVTVAAVGALIIGEVWESAAVTFLFMFGGWLEARTMGQTRGALKALLDAAPATATVLRDGEPVATFMQEPSPRTGCCASAPPMSAPTPPLPASFSASRKHRRKRPRASG